MKQCGSILILKIDGIYSMKLWNSSLDPCDFGFTSSKQFKLYCTQDHSDSQEWNHHFWYTMLSQKDFTNIKTV